MERIALITGAAGGIGRALCAAFRHDGYAVVATDRHRPDDDQNVFVEIELTSLCSDEAYRQRTIDEILDTLPNRRLDALINNAAVQILGSCESITCEELQETINVNVVAPFLFMQALLDPLQRAKGSVVNIGSVHSCLTAPRYVAYACSKAALVGLTKSMAVDLGGRVRVNVINPAATETPMLRTAYLGDSARFQELGGTHPLGRIARADEIASVAVWLSSPAASFVTGAVLNVDGGVSSRLHTPLTQPMQPDFLDLKDQPVRGLTGFSTAAG